MFMNKTLHLAMLKEAQEKCLYNVVHKSYFIDLLF